MRKYLCILAVSLFFASVSFAQKTAAHKPSFDKYEIYAGYDFDRSFGDINVFNATEATRGNMLSPFNLQGGQATVAYFPWKYVGVKAAFTYSRKHDAVTGEANLQELHVNRSYLVGPVVRWTVPNFYGGRISLFAHELLGANHSSLEEEYDGQPDGCDDGAESCRASGFAMVQGGGVNVRLTRHFAVRPLELDYWNHQVSLNHFLGSGMEESAMGNLNSTANGFRYSAGVSYSF